MPPKADPGPTPQDCPYRDAHGKPFRYCPSCAWTERDELSPEDQATIDQLNADIARAKKRIDDILERHNAAQV